MFCRRCLMFSLLLWSCSLVLAKEPENPEVTRLKKIWTEQKDLKIDTAQVKLRFIRWRGDLAQPRTPAEVSALVAANSPLEKPGMRKLLQGLLSPMNIAGLNEPWVVGGLTVKGKNSKLVVNDPSRPEKPPSMELFRDGVSVLAHSTLPLQVTILDNQKPVRISVRDLRYFPSTHETVKYSVVRETETRVYLHGQGESSSIDLELEKQTGRLLHMQSLKQGQLMREWFLQDWAEFDGVACPQVSLVVEYREGKLYEVDLKVIEQARFGQPVADAALTVPAYPGTRVTDRRQPGRALHTTMFEPDVVKFAERQGRIVPRPPAP